MFRIRMLGGLSVTRSDGTGASVAVQRRRLALLALVASTGERGMSRDRLMSYLWPESDGESARHGLKQAIFALRREFGADLFTDNGALRLSASVMISDCQALDAALAAEQLDEAMALYAGPFLDGFHLGDSPEFERWVDTERDRIAHQVQRALEARAMRAGAGGDVHTAVRHWQQLVTLDPFSSRYTLGLMSALAASGDAPEAVRLARVHEALLLQHLDAAADPAVIALAERLRRVAAMSVPSNAPAAPSRPESPSSDPPSTAAVPSPAVVAPVARRIQPRTVGMAIGGAATLGVLMLLGAVWHDGGFSAHAQRPARADDHVVAVLPFTVFGAASDSAYLREGLAELLSEDLDGAGEFRGVHTHALDAWESQYHAAPIDPDSALALAARFSAGSVVLGQATRTGNTIRLAARLYSSGDADSSTASAEVEGDTLRLLDLVDQLAARLLGERAASSGEALDPLAARTTRSLPALKAYLRGVALYHEANYAKAVDALQQAVAADSQFALAWYRLAVAADWAGDARTSLRAAEHAYQLRGRVSEHTRWLLDGYRSWRVGDIDRAERSYREVLRWNPANVEARYELGEVLFHSNGTRGRSIDEARAPFEQVLAANPDDRSSLAHLLRIVAMEGDTAAVDSVSRHLISLKSPGEPRLGVRVFRAFALRDTAAEVRALHDLQDASDELLLDWSERVAVYTGNLDAAARLARLLTQPQHARQYRAIGYRFDAIDDVARGRWHSAAIALDTAAQLPSPTHDVLYARAYLASAPFAPVPRGELTALRDTIARLHVNAMSSMLVADSALHSIGFEPLTREYMLGLLNVDLGDTTAALRDANAALRIAVTAPRSDPAADYRVGDLDGPAEYARSIAGDLRGLVAAAGMRHAQAVMLLKQSRARLWLEFLGTYMGGRGIERYTLAGELEALGHDDEALAWYSTLAQQREPEVDLRAPAEMREAEIDERLGRRAEAERHYETCLALWSGADDGLRPTVESVERRLKALQGVK
jgi:DNA-binding SARP family transcriptional activator/tetratricopeptide (TPR) repeat protein